MGAIEKFGRFDELAGCFVLEQEPPRKWNNFHYNGVGKHEVASEVSNLGDGQLFVRDEAGRTVRLVAWDASYLYVRDEESGKVFNPWGIPAPEAVSNRVCRVYREKTVISGECAGLRVTQRVFVPPEEVVGEIWTATVENVTDRPRKISLFAYARIELSGFDAENRPVAKENFAVVHPEIGGVLVTNRNTLVPSDRFKGYLISLRNFRAGCGYRDHFTRSDFGVGSPKILFGWNCGNEPGYGPDCCGLVQVTLDIPPHGSVREDFLLGQTSGLEEVKQLRDRLTPEKIDALLEKSAEHHRRRADAFKVHTGHANIDALMNVFVKKQLSRYLIEGVGFRDNLQMDNAGVLVDAEAHLNNTLFQLSSQYADGSFPLGFRPVRKHKFSDQPTYPMLTIPGMVYETGDLDVLERRVPYFESSETGTVWDHLIRAMRYLKSDLGANGLCDQRIADWNDGLEATKEAGARESVMVTQQFCYGLLQMEKLAQLRGDKAIEQESRELWNVFAQRVNDVAWDGCWYVRTICGDGYRIGSHTNKEGRIYANTQNWAVLSQIAPPDRAKLCMDAVEELLCEPLGYKICSPAYTQYDPRVGKISNGMPGHIENGGCYCHAAAFKGVADCVAGRPEEAWKTFVKLAPDNPDNPVSQSGLEPFSFTNSFSAVPYCYGRAGYPWRTGTAGWATVMLVEHILGARRSYEGLLIDPCLTKTIPHAKIMRRFRGAVYNIELDNTAGRCVGAREILVDGRKLDGRVIPPFKKGEHDVRVTI